jgi:hypothetical protein
MPCGCSAGDASAIRSTTLTTRTPSSGAISRSSAAAAIISSVATSPAHARTTSGSRSTCVDAHGHADAPRAQCAIASSIDSHWSSGCLSMMTRFTYPVLRRQ